MRMNDSSRLKKLYQIEEKRFEERVKRYKDIGYMMDMHQFYLEDVLLKREEILYKYALSTQSTEELWEEDTLGFDYEFIHKSVRDREWRKGVSGNGLIDVRGISGPKSPCREERAGSSSSRAQKAKTRVYACEIEGCNKKYTSSFGLKYHMKEGHSEEKMNIFKPYVCPFGGCDKKYKNNNGLKYHIKHYHDDQAA
ncbi:putative transcriptional G2/M transition repressor [Encephalitozoon intestinalis ATCC 50506]|uniref:Transcriptional G2/M transition repressor n=1 Tax=Encephalitozoon intestinalis (strain ATCC 50506) TaxID=876142 RepID=E0S692_ENCIT|nr:putative transcriptional G2/M transition repressor [Encephalitozoon intestinalis ATCC 50506]ADM11227.1 putative transcriptional G2/M transition repressor [Encephalitozoon intestinalis ATCC 50506]UTX44895.1 hypothetical protein GPK93_03g04220 [Encephalitozoon intestinalis]